jgi:hypothetical protein
MTMRIKFQTAALQIIKTRLRFYKFNVRRSLIPLRPAKNGIKL